MYITDHIVATVTAMASAATDAERARVLQAVQQIRVEHHLAMTGYTLGDRSGGISPAIPGPWLAVCDQIPLGRYPTRADAEGAVVVSLLGVQR